ncbi:MAG: ABC transporter ATP-binding protein [Asgard group archaeon]|nr:ABC transporter ATP-binding protein [Asgard group archaeon]
MIEIDEVNFRYKNKANRILNDFTLKIEKGEILGIIGPTGSGKSTICYLFNGLIPHNFSGDYSGSVYVNGRNVIQETVERMSGIIGYMLQEPSFQIASPFVESEIAFGMENFGLSFEEMDSRLNDILEKLSIEHLRNKSTSDLSEGEKQKVVLASILVMNPEILVLDESSSMVDSTSKKQLIKILKDLNEKENKTIILVDHDLDFLSQITKRIVLINNGAIISDGSTREILTATKLLRENGLQPPVLVSLFEKFKDQSLQIKQLPLRLENAVKIAKSWLK